jgi:hypothetical protein
MIPIYEQGDGRGIGYAIDTFLCRFDDICHEHIAEKRAKAFAFIFYDFHNEALRKILRNQGVFTQLDRLSGRDLSVFFLHTASEEAVMRFNRTFLSELGVQNIVTPPCVIFFRTNKGQTEDFEIYELHYPNLIHGFHELYTVIEDYAAGRNSRAMKYLTLFKGSARFVTTQAFGALLSSVMGKWI